MRAPARVALCAAIALAGAAPLAAPLAAQGAATLPDADAAYEAGQRERADSLYARVLAADPSATRALYRLAMLRRDRPSESVRLLRSYVAREPRDPWGHIALGDALARSGDVPGAQASYDRAERLAPGEADVARGRGRLRTLAAGRAPTVEPTTTVAEDSDRNRTVRLALAGSRQAGDRTRARGEVAVERVSDLAGSATTAELRGGLRISPRAGLHVEPTVGAVFLGVPADTLIRYVRTGTPRTGVTWTPTRVLVPGGTEVVPTGELRVRWRGAAADAPALRAVARRTVLDASPLLVSSRVLRDEVGGTAELGIAGPLRARAGGSVARLTSRTDARLRRALDGAIAVRARRWLELSVQAHLVGTDSATTAGYFAPDHAELGEFGASVEWEGARGLALSLDAGAGAQRVTRFDEPTGDWARALRLWSSASWALAPGRGIRVELEAYDSLLGSVAGSAEGWRYGSVSVGAWFGL